MKRRGYRDRLEDIQAAAEDALSFAADLDEAAFTVKLLPPELLARHPAVDWRGWARLRDVVSHQYFSLELPRLRPTIVDELPALLHVVTAELTASD